MKKRLIPRFCPNTQETVGGFCYFAFQLLLLPQLLTFLNGLLPTPLQESVLNTLFYAINFVAIILIFREFLVGSAVQAFRHPAYLLQAIVLGLAAYYACQKVTDWVIPYLCPSYVNQNNAYMDTLLKQKPALLFLGTVILVPPVEECLFRGLIFRNLFKRSAWSAYLISVSAFALIHILGYVGTYKPLELAMAVLQYLPAGLCLAWSYTKADTIFAPILIHATINFLTFSSRR